jgi:hypothetical protein
MPAAMIHPSHPNPHAEFDWLAVDEDGHVGFFSTGGYGAVPVNAPADIEPTSLHDELVTLPVTGAFVIVSDMRGFFQDWHDAAGRGLFAFNWDTQNDEYALIARPERPIVVDHMTSSRAQTLARKSLLRARFASVDSISAAIVAPGT